MASLRKRLKTKEFQDIFNKGFFVPGKQISILIQEKDTDSGGFGVTLKKKKRNAVERNFLKRRLREAFFLVQEKIPSSLNIVIIGNDLIRTASLERISSELLFLLKKGIRKKLE